MGLRDYGSGPTKPKELAYRIKVLGWWDILGSRYDHKMMEWAGK